MTESSSPFDARVEQLYLEFLTRLDRGEAPDFEALCELNPECATSLRQLRAAHEIASRAQPSAALLTERIRASHGPGVDPELSLGGVPKADADPPSALFERLRSRNPKGTRYRLLGEVGRGGMGVVLRIWDEDLRRTLAMKVVLGRDESATGDTPHVDPKTIGRFLEEAQVTGQLDHPGIVPVHELGLDTAGRVYFTMRLVKGEDLRKIYEHVESGFEDWNRTRALGVLLKVCDAMSYAHDKKVVHRDLKPANVMVGKYGEVYVMDWGLARVMGQADRHDVRLQPAAQGSTSVRTERRETRGEAPDSPLVTMDGDVVGTPSYMPPEQARGELDLLGPHSDVYAVGAMLYQLIGGEMPYVPKNAKVSPYTVLMAVLNGPPRALSELAPRAPLELLAICERAMQREITERYRDTRELGDDLRAYLERRVVKAYETGTWAETKKWMQRNRAVSLACASLLIAMTGALYANQLRIEQSKLRATESERARLALAEVNLTLERKNAELRAERLDDMLRGMIQDLARLRAQSRTLDGLEHLGKPAYLWWIEETEGLLGGREEDSAHRVAWRPGLKDVRAELARLRALPALLAYTEEDAERDFQSHPDQYLLRRVEQREDSDEREVQLRELLLRCRERRTWRFADGQLEWWHSLLTTLEADLLWQARMLEVAREAAFSPKAKARWAEAIEAIARAPKYAGQKWPTGERLTPQLGLLPLGENPATGLWEFVHLQTGTEPTLGPDGRVLRDGEGKLALTPESGMIVVLLPGGRVPTDENEASLQRDWITRVDLDPFFLSSCELTHEQWDRVSLRRGFHYGADRPLVPANNNSWNDIAAMLQRGLGWCDFPSQARWEYGCRAGTTSSWWPGNDSKLLAGVANVDYSEPNRRHYPDIQSVGSLRPNAFGLHDVYGNVWELCGDVHLGSDATPRKSDGLIDGGADTLEYRVARGAAWHMPAVEAQSSFTGGEKSVSRSHTVGVRLSIHVTP